MKSRSSQPSAAPRLCLPRSAVPPPSSSTAVTTQPVKPLSKSGATEGAGVPPRRRRLSWTDGPITGRRSPSLHLQNSLTGTPPPPPPLPLSLCLSFLCVKSLHSIPPPPHTFQPEEEEEAQPDGRREDETLTRHRTSGERNCEYSGLTHTHTLPGTSNTHCVRACACVCVVVAVSDDSSWIYYRTQTKVAPGVAGPFPTLRVHVAAATHKVT